MTRRISALVAAAAMLFTLTVAPAAHADPPERFDEPFFSLFLDTKHNLAAFWNITRDDFCDWVASDFDGPPPVQEPVPVLANEVRSGAVVASFRATTRPFELWNIDDPANPSGPCEDTAGQSAPLATGNVTVSGHDNDLFVSLTRANAFGETGTGTIYDATGAAWHYSWIFKAQITKNDEFRIVTQNFNLKKMGK